MKNIEVGKGNVGAFKPRKGLKEFLYALKTRSLKIGLVTSDLEYKAVPEILSTFRVPEMGNPLEFYDGIITCGSQKTDGQYGTIGEMEAKAHPWLYAELAIGMGITDKSQAVVVEDSSAGVLSGMLADFPVIGFSDGNILSSYFETLCCNVVNSFDEITELL